MSKSKLEDKLYQYVKSKTKCNVVRNYVIPDTLGLEIDIYIPKLKLGFEVNGKYYHSVEFRPKGYHYLKTNKAEQSGIRLFHLWESEIIANLPKILRFINLRLSNNESDIREILINWEISEGLYDRDKVSKFDFPRSCKTHTRKTKKIENSKYECFSSGQIEVKGYILQKPKTYELDDFDRKLRISEAENYHKQKSKQSNKSNRELYPYEIMELLRNKTKKKTKKKKIAR